MSKPIVAIIGKPNVGKSTFFNYVVGKRISIVEDTPGVTRDRVQGESTWRGVNFNLIDTGGIEPDSDDIILSQMRLQANIAIDIADVIVFLTDVRQGVTAADEEIAIMLKTPTIWSAYLILNFIFHLHNNHQSGLHHPAEFFLLFYHLQSIFYHKEKNLLNNYHDSHK